MHCFSVSFQKLIRISKNVIPFGTAVDVPWMSAVTLAMKTSWNALSNAKASQAHYPTHHLL